jgi:hypothetical protein
VVHNSEVQGSGFADASASVGAAVVEASSRGVES